MTREFRYKVPGTNLARKVHDVGGRWRDVILSGVGRKTIALPLWICNYGLGAYCKPSANSELLFPPNDGISPSSENFEYQKGCMSHTRVE